MKARMIVALLLTVAVVGCSKPTIDATTDATMQESVKKVRESLPEADREKFDNAMQRVAFSKIDFGKMFTEGEKAAYSVVSDMKKAVHGKTGPGIIAMAGEIERKEREAKRAEAMKEMQQLQKERDADNKARAELAKFQVLSAT
jgi:PBP1b-binding outer membrane lipoprotein LpoB